MTPAPRACPPDETQEDELRAFLLVVREALLMIVRFIEKRYGKEQSPRTRA